MKKIFLFCVILACAGFAQAQITISQNDFATTGTIITMTDDTMPAALVLGAAGPNQTWDFSTLNNHLSYQYHFVNPASAPFASTFPGANLVIDVVGSGYFYYLASSSTALTAVGQSGDFLDNGNPMAIRLNPPDKILEFPSTYQSMYSNIMSYDETIYYNMVVSGYQIDSVRMKSIQQKNSLIDAWGTMTTPEGSFPCIRQKNTNAVTDSSWGLVNIGGNTMWVEFDNSYTIESTYSWYANGVGMPLVEVTYDTTNNTAIEASWVITSLTYNKNDNPLAINTDNNLQIYPNPATDVITVIGAGAFESSIIVIYNSLGQEVMRTEYSGGSPVSIPVHNLKSGIYIIENINGLNKVGRARFVKS